MLSTKILMDTDRSNTAPRRDPNVFHLPHSVRTGRPGDCWFHPCQALGGGEESHLSEKAKSGRALPDPKRFHAPTNISNIALKKPPRNEGLLDSSCKSNWGKKVARRGILLIQSIRSLLLFQVVRIIHRMC